MEQGLWTVGDIANGASATLTINTTVNANQGNQAITINTTAASGNQQIRQQLVMF